MTTPRKVIVIGSGFAGLSVASFMAKEGWEVTKNRSDYYSLQPLDPSYRIYWNDTFADMPADLKGLKQFFESLEPGSAIKLDRAGVKNQLRLI
jgi:phytoene desaturase